MFKKVLVPTDFSEYAQKTLECIGDIPGVKEIVLLHVVDPAYLSKRGLAQEPYVQNAMINLEEQKKRLESIGLEVKLKVDEPMANLLK